MHGNPDADIMRDIVQLLRERIDQGLLTIFIKIKAHRGDIYWTDNGTTHRSNMNPTVKKKIVLQVSQQQLKIYMGSTANFLIREDSSRDLLGKFHKDRSVWIRARQRVLQCLSYQFPCALQFKPWGILNDVKCRLCEKNLRKRTY